MEKNEDTENIIRKTINGLIDGVTAVAISDKKQYVLSVSRILKNVRATNLLSVLNEEWQRYKREGKIKTEYEQSEEHLDNLSEILDYLDNDIPNSKVFNLLKKIFLKAAINGDPNDPLPMLFLKIARSLSEGELILLAIFYKIAKDRNHPVWPDIISFQKTFSVIPISTFNEMMAKHSGLIYPELIFINDELLLKKGLVTARAFSDNSGININDDFRLSKLGLAFCEYVDSFEEN